MVTGATGGLGQAIARRLRDDGARLTLTARRTEILDSLAGELGAEVIAADLNDPGSVRSLGEAISGADILIANAGLGASQNLVDLDPEEIQRVVTINLQVPAVLAGMVAPHMAARGRGQIVFISSMAGKVVTPGNGPLYTATKWGVRGLGLALREELRAQNVGVSTIFPGPIRNAGMFAKAGVKLPRSIPTNTPEEVATAVASAIAGNRAEISVAAPLVRFGGLLGGVAPGFVAATARRQGADNVRRKMADAGASKRTT